MQIAVHLWATGRGTLSSHSFLIIKDLASVFSSSCFDTCLVKTYKAFIGHCQFMEPDLFKHVQFLRNSLVELCSLDVQKSSNKAMICIKQVAKILQQGLQMKKKVHNDYDFSSVSCFIGYRHISLLHLYIDARECVEFIDESLYHNVEGTVLIFAFCC